MIRISVIFLLMILVPLFGMSQTRSSNKSGTKHTTQSGITKPPVKKKKNENLGKSEIKTSISNKTAKADTMSIPTKSMKSTAENNIEGDNLSLEELKRIESFGNSTKDIRRFDKSTISVLPVVLYSSGNDGKSDVQKVIGDILVSEKHYLNTYQTEINVIIEKLLSDELDARKFWGVAPLEGPQISYLNIKKQFQKTFSASNLTNQIIKKTTGVEYVKLSKNDDTGIKIKHLLEASDEPFKMLKIWRNASTLISRAEFTLGDIQKKANLDPKKYDNYKKLLMRNYILVCTIENPSLPEKQKIYRANVSGYLYRIIWSDNIQNDLDKARKSTKYNLDYIGNIKIKNMSLDPRSDEFIDRYNLKSGPYEKNKNGEIVESLNSVYELFNKSILSIFDEMGRKGNRYFQDGEYLCANRMYIDQIQLSLKFPNLNLNTESVKEKSLECVKNIELSPNFNPIKFKKSTSEEKRARKEWEENKIIPLSQSRKDKLLAILKNFFYSTECDTQDMNLYDKYIFAQAASNGLLEEFEKEVEDLKVKARIIKANPILSDIGRKEGVFRDQRYRVYEQVKREDGSIERIKRASVRAVRVAENTEKYMKFNIRNLKDSLRMLRREQFSYSKFKQIDGKKIEEGMLLEQDDDRGIGFQVGYLYMNGNSGPQIGFDYRFSKLFRKKAFTSGLKVGADIGIYNVKGEAQMHSVLGLQLYISKEMYLSPKYDIKPVLGYNLYGGLYLGSYFPINIVGKASQFSKFKIVPMLSFSTGSNNISINSNKGSDRVIVKGGFTGSLSIRFDI